MRKKPVGEMHRRKKEGGKTAVTPAVKPFALQDAPPLIRLACLVIIGFMAVTFFMVVT